MTDSAHQVARAKDALAAVAADPKVLGALHDGLLTVPVEPASLAAIRAQARAEIQDDLPKLPTLAVRRRDAG
jgi:hypothetical protein